MGVAQCGFCTDYTCSRESYGQGRRSILMECLSANVEDSLVLPTGDDLFLLLLLLSLQLKPGNGGRGSNKEEGPIVCSS